MSFCLCQVVLAGLLIGDMQVFAVEPAVEKCSDHFYLAARECNRTFNYTEAEKLLKRARDLSVSSKANAGVNVGINLADIDIELAESYLGQLKFDRAIASLNNATGRLGKKTKMVTRVNLLRCSATCYRLKSNTELAMKKCNEAIKILESNKLERTGEYCECLVERSKIEFTNGNILAARTAAQRAVDIAPKVLSKNDARQVLFLNNLADIYSSAQQSEYKNALTIRNQAVSLARKMFGANNRLTCVVLRNYASDLKRLAVQAEEHGCKENATKWDKEADTIYRQVGPKLVNFGLQSPSVVQK